MAIGSLGVKDVAEALSREKKILISAHVKPDGDALGSVIAMHLGMQQLGADSVMFFAGNEPAAPEYDFLTTLDQAVRGAPPADLGQRTLVALDSGNAERLGLDAAVKVSPRIINIDHHIDNARFGELNLVRPEASSTAEIVYAILKEMGVTITREIAEALYTGILVDSGRFQYSSTSPGTFRAAAELIELGVDHTAIFRHVYENMPLGKVKLLSHALSTLVIGCDGKLAAAVLDEEAFREAGATTGLTEGLVENLRAIEGVTVGALIYARVGEATSADQPHYRVSLRSASEEVNVQQIAKLKGGGGHPQAAGFSADESPAKLIEFVAREVARALAHKEAG